MSHPGTDLPRYPFPAEQLEIGADYAPLRAAAPATKVQLPYGGAAWLVTRYDEVKQVLADPRFSRMLASAHDKPRFFPQPMVEGQGIMDPPEHTRLRRLVAKGFGARRVEPFRPRVEAIVGELLDAMEHKGPPVDVVEHIALALPGRAICEFMGIPYADRDKFEPFFDAIVSTTAVPPEEIMRARTTLEDYIHDLVAERRRNPTDDLFTALIRARDEGDALTEEELTEIGFGFLVAGFETTGSQIGNFLVTLFAHPDQLAAVRADPDMIPDAVEELLRFIPLLAVGVPAIATEDTEIGGVLICAGESVVPSLNAANRDEPAFPDPDRLDVRRRPNPHVAFGHGVHHCVGAQLARVELLIVLRELLRRFPALALVDDPRDLDWKSGMVVRGVRSLRVTW